jgi:hypothetical protein
MTDTTEVVWSDPPRLSEKRYVVLDACKANPGRWAQWPFASTAGQSLKAQGFEYVTRTIDGETRAWVRWPNGDDSST